MDPSFEAKRDHPLSAVCTFGIGGPAKYYLEVRTIADMQQIVLYCHQQKHRYMILGRGSNCLFDDRGFDGLVIANKIDFLEEQPPNLFYVGAGYNFSRLGAYTARHGWSGLEFASGIPGSVGGAVYMNAGANGGDTQQTLQSVDFVDEEGRLLHLKRADLDFSYRTSSFQRRQGAIVAATFALTREETARAKQLNIVDYRIKTQPYSDMSAGCVFRNPGSTPAGALIERCGLKDTTVGGAKVSPMHANFIVNTGNATAKDVLELMILVQEGVKDATGIEMESEVRVIPYQEGRE